MANPQRSQSMAFVASDDPIELMNRQYELAGTFAGEFVILRGTEVMHHSRNRVQAFEAYDRFLAQEDRRPLVIVHPNRGRPALPLLRGRAIMSAPTRTP